jgi:Uma2 family endonuclease
MATVPITKRYSLEEYLSLERKAQYKSEYRSGFIVAMPAASREHNVITVNFSAEIRARLRMRACEVYASDMCVQTSPTGLYTYPDVVVVCDEPRFLDDEFDTLLNPTLLVEVLSPSTEDYDRGDKFDQYKAIESLREYSLVAQDRVLVERFVKRGKRWMRTEYRDLDGTLEPESIGSAIPMREIYAKVKLADRARAED